MAFKAGYYTLGAVEVAIACPLLVSAAAFVSIGRAWGDDGGFELEFAEDDGDFIMGAGGFPSYVGNENDLAYLNLTLTPTSQAYRLLGQMYLDWKRKTRALAQFLPISVNMLDRANLDALTEPAAGFISGSLPSKMKSKSDQVFRLGLPNAKDQIIRGAGLLVGV